MPYRYRKVPLHFALANTFSNIPSEEYISTYNPVPKSWFEATARIPLNRHPEEE